VVKEMKDTTLNLLRHGITNKAILKVEAGAQHQEGVYEIELTYVQLTQTDASTVERPTNPNDMKCFVDSDKEEKFFERKPLGKILVNSDATYLDFYKQVFAFVSESKDPQVSIQDMQLMRLRNPKNDDLGDLIPLIDSTE
jgi:hypothetical protein